MTNAASAFRFVKDDDSIDLRAHYAVVAQDTLRILWRRKGLIAATVAAGLAIAIIALAQMGPRYMSEALIQLNLNRDVTSGTKSQPIASVDAADVVNSAARIIRSQTTADAVVVKLGLAKKPDFEPAGYLARWFSALRSAVGLQLTAPTPHDLAVDALMRQVRVTTEPRSYVISVVVTSGSPEVSARLANAVAIEYLHSRRVQELAEARSVAEHDLADASLVFGPRHPTFLRTRARLEQLDAQLATLRDTLAEDPIKLAEQGVIAARKVMRPSGANVPAYLALAVVVSLSLGICLACYTRVGFFWPVIIEGALILLLAACALVNGIFAIVRGIRAVRQHVRLNFLLREGFRRIARL